MLSAAEALGAGGPFGRRIPGFAVRPQQQEIAAEIAHTLEAGGVLICEAGTGSGKTLAYLTPAVLSGRRIIVSTGTRTLQEQLYHRDLPAVCEALGVSPRSALLKGRGNYLCRHRLGVHEAHGGHEAGLQAELARIREWAGETRTGDIAELAGIAEDAPVWRLATSTRDNCLGQECPSWGECHVLHARRAAVDAELVVVNHHLFFADMALREEGFGELLPGADAVIFDEAHQLPEIATRFFGVSLGAGQLLDLARDSTAAWHREAADVAALPGLARGLERAARELRLGFGLEEGRIAWPALAGQAPLAAAVEALAAALAALGEALEAVAERGRDLQSCARRCHELRARLQTLAAPEGGSGQVRWVELRGRGFTWHASPLEIGPAFAARMAEQDRAWVFTSATLAVEQRFDHFADRMGLGERRERLWQSPFDFRRQALCYVPEGLPEPGRPGYGRAALEAALPVLEASRGRAFLLFTSHQALQAAAGRLRGGPWSLLVQGGAARSELVRRFRETPGAVLLGTASFWEGVDVRGEALSCVIIDKLPFAAPDDPVLEARCRALRERGENPFLAYQLPQAVIALKQGVGRLIRDAGDRGVLMLCDPRLYSRSYGRVFLESLPPMHQTRRLEEVREFFTGARHAGAGP